MNDNSGDDVLSRWARVATTAGRFAQGRGPKPVGRTRGAGAPIATLAIAILVVVAIIGLRQSPSPAGIDSAGVPSSPSAVQSSDSPTGTATVPSSTPSIEPSPSIPTSADLTKIATVARAFESARASGKWQAAWSRLSAYSQAQYGSITKFASMEDAYNTSGGDAFTMADPTRDPDLLDPAFLGAAGSDAELNANFDRAALVFANHPHVKGASEASRAYLVAPSVSERWQVWVVR